MSSNPIEKPRSRKEADRPKKPYTAFPLSPHATGKWCKKIRGKVHYFGSWATRVNGQLVRVAGDGWEQALALYKAQADDLHAGRVPRERRGGELTIKELCNEFLTSKNRKYAAGEMSARMFKPGPDPEHPYIEASGEYKNTCVRLIKIFGAERLVDDLYPDDFGKLRADLAEQYGPVRLRNEIIRAKSVFKFAFKNKHIKQEVEYGSEFNMPDRGILRKHKAEMPKKELHADEIRRLLDVADVQMRAMTLLGINCAFGNADCGKLPLSAVNLESAWVEFPRPKTGIGRKAKLWRETVQALRDAIAQRPTPKDHKHAGLLFITKYGAPWFKGSPDSPVSKEFTKLLRSIGIHREGVGFYALRHVFRTVGDKTLDRTALDLIMGHHDASMGRHYVESIDDARLVAVAEHVRQWLFGAGGDGAAGDDDAEAGESAGDNADSDGQDDDGKPMTLKLYVEGGAA